MPTERELLEDYVRAGKLTQIASFDKDGSLSMCNVWYDAHFAPDLIRFISRHDRQHSQNIRSNGHIAGSIIAIPLEGLGQVVRGVTYTGRAHELPTIGVDAEVAAFISRWPAAEKAIETGKLARDATASRLYEISITEWVLFDEENFPAHPRRVVPVIQTRG